MTKTKMLIAESFKQAEADESFFEQVCPKSKGQKMYRRLKEWRAKEVPLCSQHPDYKFDQCPFCDVSETLQWWDARRPADNYILTVAEVALLLKCKPPIDLRSRPSLWSGEV
jgi:hypothetical protein